MNKNIEKILIYVSASIWGVTAIIIAVLLVSSCSVIVVEKSSDVKVDLLTDNDMGIKK